VLIRGPTAVRLTLAATIAQVAVACIARPVRDADWRRQLEPIVRGALAAEREAFVRGDAQAALRQSGLDSVHWPAVRPRADTAAYWRARLLALGHDYHAILSASERWDSVRTEADRATAWVSAYTVYAHRRTDGDTTGPPTMGEEVPHVFSFARRGGRLVLVRDSVVSMAELHRRSPMHAAQQGPPVTVPPARVDTSIRERAAARAAARRAAARRDRALRRPFSDRNEMEADIARGPVPGYAGVMIEGGCTIVVLLTDTITQKAAAEAYLRLEMERRRPSASSSCGASYRFRFRQVRYDFAQLYDWYVGPFRTLHRVPGLTMTDIDEARNELTAGVEDSAAYRRMVAAAAALPIPAGVVRVIVSGRICVGTGGPSVVVEVRDPQGRPAAIGTTIVIQDGAFRDSVDGAHALSELRVGAGERRPGRYEVRLHKPGYRPVILHDVMAPGDEHCRYAEPTDIRKVQLQLLPDAPKVRSIVVLPPGIVFSVPDDSLQLRAVLDADPDVSHAIRWRSSDTTVVTVSETGMLRTKCRATNGRAVVTATSVAHPRVQGQVIVGLLRPEPEVLHPGPGARQARECLERLRRTPPDSLRGRDSVSL
jgi:hypothetical protein